MYRFPRAYKNGSWVIKMKTTKLSTLIHIKRPQYVYLKLKPANHIRNNQTHKLAKTIASLYKNIMASIQKEQEKAFKVFHKQFMVGTRYSYLAPTKIGYLIYIEKQKVEFYFIIPKHAQTILKEKITDVWGAITVEEVSELPAFEKPTQYQLMYQKEDALSLAADRRDNELLNSTLNVIDVMKEGDRAAVFYNFIPCSQFSWGATYQATMDKLKHGKPVDRNKMGVLYALKLGISLFSSLAEDLGEAIGGGKKGQNDNLFEGLIDRLNGGRQIGEATKKKGTSVILNTQIAVLSESQDSLRQRNNARSLVQAFDTVIDDNRLIAKPLRPKVNFTGYRLNGAEVNKVGDLEAQNFIALAGREALERYPFIDKVETQETKVPEDLQKGVLCIGTNTYRGHEQPAYLSTDKEYKQLTTVLIGPTRAGKSTLIGNLSNDALKNGECVIIFDYIKNCELSEEVAALFPAEKVLNIECDEFEKLQGLGYNEIGYSQDPFQQYDNAKKQTTQLLALVNSINTDDSRLSAKMERYLTSAALVVFINNGSIRDVFNVLQDHNARHAFINKVPTEQWENLSEYIASLGDLDDTDKDGALTGTKLHLIVGIIDRLNKLKANTYMELMLKKPTDNNVDLATELQKNQLICIKMPEFMFSTDGERDVYTTYWISKLWLALQVRGQKIKDRDKLTKVNLIIDELYQVENTEKFLTEKLSRLAKFGLKPIISCHYLNQIKHIREELRSANASYMLISGFAWKSKQAFVII